MSFAPISIIIPTLNSATTIKSSIASLFPALEEGLIRELIISDGGSNDEIEEIANYIGAKFISGDQGRGTQLNVAAATAKGDWLLFLHSDTCLEIGWTHSVRYHIENSSDAAYFKLQFAAQGFAPSWVAGWANFRSRCFDLPYGDQGLLISRLLYEEIGGYLNIPIMEDLDISRRLKGHLRMMNSNATTDPIKYLQEGWIKRGSRNLFLMIKYLAGVSPKTLASKY